MPRKREYWRKKGKGHSPATEDEMIKKTLIPGELEPRFADVMCGWLLGDAFPGARYGIPLCVFLAL